jgi:dTDP-glucose pyrophosphorylase
MKILTIAAGRGTRVQTDTYIPKALIQVRDKTLLEWSVDSFHAIRSQGLVKTEDLIFVFLKSDIEQFNIEEIIRNKIGEEVTIVILEDLTSGPAETAKLAIEKLVREKFITLEEAIIVNDCDHHFKSDSMVRLYQKNSIVQEQIIIFETEKNPDDLSWSFVKRDAERVVGIIEKPTIEEKEWIDTSLGIVGVYYFPQVSRFLELFNDAMSSSIKNEIYISNLINCAIAKGVNHDVVVSRIYDFVPLGSHSQITKAVAGNQLFQKFKEPVTVFFDLDGTLVEHDASKSLGSGKYGELKFLSASTATELNRLYGTGTVIILTTARLESSRDSLESELAQNGVMYDQLIMGISGGARFLINDNKPSLPGFLTAWSINTHRNKCVINQVSGLVATMRDLKLIYEFPNESGEVTVLLESAGRKFVRKISQSTETSKELIQYQAEWLKIVKEILPNMVPKVMNLEVGPQNEFRYYDMEYIENLKPLGEHIFSSQMSESRQTIDQLVLGLQTIYTKFSTPQKADMSDLIEIVNQKVIPGIEKGLESLKLDLESIELPLSVNGEPVFNVLKDVRKHLTKDNILLMDILGSETYYPTLIHGDPTLSNIMTDEDKKIYLLDPIGSRVRPNFEYFKEGLGRSNPIYDHSRVRLSLIDEYEKWSSDIMISETGVLTEISFVKNEVALELYEHFDRSWSLSNSTNDPRIKDIVYFTTLARILPYKARGKEKEALYILHLLSREWQKIKMSIV